MKAKAKRKQSKLSRWLNDTKPQQLLDGQSPKKVFTNAGIKTVKQLKEFLAEPDVVTFLIIARMKEGEVKKITIHGKPFMAMKHGGGLTVTDDFALFDAVSDAFDKVVPKFKSQKEIRSWIKSLPKIVDAK